MPLLEDVLGWSGGQAPWVQDALRRLFVTDGPLTRQDYEELMSLLLDANGIAQEPRPTPVPLAAEHLPAAPIPGETCVIRIGDMRNVNRFASGRCIEFAPTGLNLVFGQNGAGKSGVARVLKQVCRARHRQKVLPDAFAADFVQRVPSATISYVQDGHGDSFSWSMAAAAPTQLQSIALLDDACAHDYVSGESDTSFQPFGLGHVERLAKEVFPELLARVNGAIGALDCDVGPFKSLAPPNTAVGKILATISPETDPNVVAEAGSLSGEERDKHSDLRRVLAEPDADARASTLEGFASRLEDVYRGATRARAFVDDRAIARWRTLLEAADAAIRSRNDVEALIQGEHLPGTGGNAWRVMFEAAKTFSLQAAYVDRPAPVTEQGTRCVLCQTILDAEAGTRLRQFNEFVVSDAVQMANTATRAVDEARTAITDSDLGLSIDEALRAEIANNAPELLAILENARHQFDERRKWMLDQTEARAWDAPPPLDFEPSALSQFLAIAARVRSTAAGYRTAADHDARVALEKEAAELAGRIALEPHAPALLAVISHLRQRAALQACATLLDTAPISRQCGALATRYITDALLASMVDELKRLGVGRIAHSFRKRTERGRTMVSLVLEGSSAKPGEILSEGEKRMAAIAFFLAELAQSGSCSAIIADDPVSSLDHKYRHRVAQRLVEESCSRQVIVLTHDAVFLSALLNECERLAQTPFVQTLGWSDGSPGYAEPGLPWMNKSVGERLDRLDAEQRAIASRWCDHPDEGSRAEMAAIYGRMRGTLERVIRESIFNKAISPFDDRVKIERVGAIAGFTEAEFRQIERIYLRCNPAIDGHDSSGEGARDIPNPAELAEDITAMRALIATATARRNAMDRQAKPVAAATRRE